MTRMVNVALGARSYDILIGAGLLAEAGRMIAARKPGARVGIVTDATVAALHLPTLQASLDAAGLDSTIVTVPAGEGTKSFAGLEHVTRALLAARLERRDAVVALGGGMVGDLAGLAAALVKRGLDIVQIPTTLLSQVDSSVGGKTAINTPEGKNLVGVFHQPSGVLIDTDLLATLPPRELRAGYAEVVKYGALGDAEMFAWLERHGPAVLAGDAEAQAQAIATSCAMKARIVAEDERETADRRALLNLGHTFGHALEAATGFGEALLHGEAVAIGMVQAFTLSAALGLCPPGDAARLRTHLRAMGLPVSAREVPGLASDPQALLAHMRHDKKAEGTRLVFVLARRLGEAFVARDVPEAAVLQVLAQDLAPAS